LVRLNDFLLNTVVFLGMEEDVLGTPVRVPRASAFIVGIDDEDPSHVFPYVVTARHCIEETAGREFFVRANYKDGIIDKPTTADDWFLHDDADVALAPFHPYGKDHAIGYHMLTKFVPGDYKVDPAISLNAPPGSMPPVDVMPGDGVVFLSLFVQAPGRDINLPVARFGHIARMPGEPISFTRTGGTTVDLVAYLAECHSWGGHSGAPVLWHFQSTVVEPAPTPAGVFPVSRPQEITALLGLVSGHFDIEQEARVEGDILGSVMAKSNAGMALVTPAEAIRELLMRDDVAEERKTRVERAQAAKPTATFDSDFPPPPDGGLTRASFDDALSRATRITPPAESAPEG